MDFFIEMFGWYGTVGLISAYALVSFGVLSARSLWYQVLNITAALGIVVVSFYKGAYQPGVLNLVWFIIGVVSLVLILVRKKR